MEDKITKFKELIKEHTTLKIFHRKYVLPKNPSISYNYFIKQINGHDNIVEEVDIAINEYLIEHDGE